jgi:IclR family KDG regulon transcriptional repressor
MAVDYTVPAIYRMVKLLDILSNATEGMSLTQLAEMMDVPKSTLFRILVTLVEQGILHEDTERRRFSLGVKLVEWGTAALDRIDIKGISHPHLVELATATHESFYLAILDHDEVVLIDRVDTPEVWKIVTRLGHRSPIHCTASGQVIAAYQPEPTWEKYLTVNQLRKYTSKTVTIVPKLKKKFEEIKKLGYAIAEGEFKPDLWAAAVPIFDHAGHVMASIMVAMPSDRAEKNADYIQDLIARLQGEAYAISLRIGFKGNLG